MLHKAMSDLFFQTDQKFMDMKTLNLLESLFLKIGEAVSLRGQRRSENFRKELEIANVRNIVPQ
jgi:hypothetical protein